MINDCGFGLGKIEPRVDTTLATKARAFKTTKWRVLLPHEVAVDNNRAGADFPGDTYCAIKVTRPNITREAKLAIVGQGNGVILRRECADRRNRAKDLFALDPAVGRSHLNCTGPDIVTRIARRHSATKKDSVAIRASAFEKP